MLNLIYALITGACIATIITAYIYESMIQKMQEEIDGLRRDKRFLKKQNQAA